MLHDDDHRALGHRLGLFHLQEEAAGSVFWHPRGLMLLRALEDQLRRIVLREGYREVRSPQVLSSRSGSEAATGACSGRECWSWRARRAR
jgi:threonyl-tRNA synthetase